jgi:hypothetical protein
MKKVRISCAEVRSQEVETTTVVHLQLSHVNRNVDHVIASTSRVLHNLRLGVLTVQTGTIR